MTSPNFKNRTLWTGDNLDILRGMSSESVDLIYLFRIASIAENGQKRNCSPP